MECCKSYKIEDIPIMTTDGVTETTFLPENYNQSTLADTTTQSATTSTTDIPTTTDKPIV